jgi:hypothetical protein
MASSASERIPVEIWHLILHHAVASPLLPFTEEGDLSTHLIETLHLFSATCQHCFIYRDVTQATIERLRLVCRTWATILRDSANEFALTDLKSNHYPSEQMSKSARRVQVWTEVLCKCRRSSGNVICNFPGSYNVTEWRKEMGNEQSLQTRIPHVKILILNSLEISTLKSLNPLSQLVAISLKCEDYPDMCWSMKEISNYAPRLTHLRLERLDEFSRLLAEDFMHYNLRYLSLKILYGTGRTFSPRKIMNWTFPSLETVHIRGDIHSEHKDSVSNFIIRHEKGLHGLDVLYRICTTSKQPLWEIPSDLWDRCPYLTQLGIHSHHLMLEIELLGTERDPICPPLELFIQYGFDRRYIELSKLAILLKGLVKRWNVSKIVTSETWNKIGHLR